MKFCKTCGYGMPDSAHYCTHCNNQMSPRNTLSDQKLNSLATRIRINGILWIIIGVIQLCTGVFLPVGILNIISAFRDLKTAKELTTYRVGLVRAYTPVTWPVITLIYNLVFGGVIGVAGSLYYFIAIRGYVMSNKEYFNTLK